MGSKKVVIVGDDRDVVKSVCRHCGHVEKLGGLDSWSAILLGHKCEKCNERTTLEGGEDDHEGQNRIGG